MDSGPPEGSDLEAVLDRLQDWEPTVSTLPPLLLVQVGWLCVQIPDEAMDYLLNRTGFQCPNQLV